MLFTKQVLLITSVVLSQLLTAQIYIGKTCVISFSAPTPVEDIAAINSITKPLLNISTGDLQMKIVMTAFIFEKPLMQEHFNENYVESEKFPNAFFKGKINEKIDFNTDGVYKVTATGKFTIHGVEQEKTIDGTITIMDKEIKLSSDFKITFADYKVDIPALYSGVIPPDAQVKINALLEPFKK
ncbi:MAG: YceI family protein [Bacteroidia bacterium]